MATVPTKITGTDTGKKPPQAPGAGPKSDRRLAGYARDPLKVKTHMGMHTGVKS